MKNRLSLFLGAPPFLWLILFVILPFLIVVAISVMSRGTYGGVEWAFNWQNYARLLNPVYLEIFSASLKLSLITSIICLLVSYPLVWALVTSDIKIRKVLLSLLIVPFFTNLITRIYAVKLFTSMDGVLQRWLAWLGIGFDPFVFSQNQILVLYAMVITYLPFMMFPLYAALEKFDFSLIEAAQDLGASSSTIFFKVILPNTKIAALSGITLVFVPCLGEFVIPDLLGGAKTMLIGNLITEQFLKSRDWPFGAALSIVLVIILLIAPKLIGCAALGRSRNTHD